MKNLILLLFWFLFSCNNKEQNKKELVNTQVEPDKTVSENKKDTTIVYNIEGISSEGTEAKTFYVNNKIKKAEIGIAGAEGQCIIVYVFSGNKINVLEKQYHYKAGIESVKSDKDMKLEKEISYVMDFNGTLIGKGDADRLDIFNEFKKVVPFELK